MPDHEEDLGQTIHHVLHLIRKRRWWVMLPAALSALAAVGVALVLPDRYESEVTLAVVQQQIAQTLVAPITTTTIADAVDAMTREVLSRNRLLAIIEEFDLYATSRQNSTPEVLAERMRKDVKIEPLELASARDFTAFKISFVANNPQLAQRVVSRLASLFIQENLKTRGNQATKTADFLNDQVTAAKQRLAEQEQRLADFKTSNVGELPEQQASNIGALTQLRMELTTVLASQRRAQEQRASTESSIAENVARLEAEKAILLTRLTPRHPEVVKKDQEITGMRVRLEKLKSGTSNASSTSNQSSAEDLSVAQLQNELESLSREEQRLRAEIAQYQRRIDLTPVREQQLASILRNYEMYKQDYADLVNKQLRSQQSVSVEERQEGQQFRLVDPPTLPVVPSSPKRVQIGLGGAAGGIALGLALAFLMNLRNHSFYSDKELKQHFQVPLVVTVPELLTPAEERERNWQRVFEWLAAAAMTVIVCAAEFYVFRHR